MDNENKLYCLQSKKLEALYEDKVKGLVEELLHSDGELKRSVKKPKTCYSGVLLLDLNSFLRSKYQNLDLSV